MTERDQIIHGGAVPFNSSYQPPPASLPDHYFSRLRDEIDRVETMIQRIDRRLTLMEMQINNLSQAGQVPPILQMPPMMKMGTMEKMGALQYLKSMHAPYPVQPIPSAAPLENMWKKIPKTDFTTF